MKQCPICASEKTKIIKVLKGRLKPDGSAKLLLKCMKCFFQWES